MEHQQTLPGWMSLAVVECPACQRAVAFDEHSSVTVIHEASRSNQSSWSIGVQCPVCRTRIVTRVSFVTGIRTPHVDVVGYFDPATSKR